MPTSNMQYEYLFSDNTNRTFDGADQYIIGGHMAAAQIARRWINGAEINYWEYYIETQIFDGEYHINAGGGDDLVQVSSGNDTLNGGGGLDILDFSVNPFDIGHRSTFEYSGGYPYYHVELNLQTGRAVFHGRDVVERFSSIVTDEAQDAIDTMRFEFSTPDFGSYNTRVRGFEAVRASTGDDTITGSDAAFEFFDMSLGGADTVDGAGGTDWVGFGRLSGILFSDDTLLRLNLATGRAQTLEHTGSALITNVSRFRNVENVLGSPADDIIVGDRGNNTIAGGLGDDSLDGGRGIDTLMTEFRITDAWDNVIDSAWDSRHGPREQPSRGVFVHLGRGTVTETDGGTTVVDRVVNFENVIGTSRNDRLTGDAGHNQLTGGAGKDRLSGGAGNDDLFGGRASDTLDGGRGDDRLTGGAGGDVFVFSRGDGHDVVNDFNLGGDRLKLDDALWGGDLTLARVMDRFADDTGRDILLDFGARGSILIGGIATIGGLSGAVDIL